MKLLQVNLGKSKQAKSLLLQTARDRQVDILLISEQYRKLETVNWYEDSSKKSAIVVCNSELRVRSFCQSIKGFIWVEFAELRVYSSYVSPCDTLDVFIKEIHELEDSIRSTTKDVLLTGDFNSESLEWGDRERIKEVRL